jgi:flagellar biosynthesis regulator FlbT
MSTTASAINVDELAAQKQHADKEFAKAVESRFLAIATSARIVTDKKLDKKLLAQRAFEVLKTKHVVNIHHENDDRRNPAKSSSKVELATEIFRVMPSASEADTNLFAEKVRDRCLSAVWNVTQTGDRGQVQKLLRADNLLLIRGSVFRETPTGASHTVNDGLYVSTHEEVVLREFLAPRLEKLRKLTDALEDDYEMVTDRVPGLGAPMRAAIEAALVEATAKLPVTTLGSGTANGQKSIGK